MNKTAIIAISGLAVLGIGGYFYFKTKAKKTGNTSGLPSIASSLANQTSGTSTTGTPTNSAPNTNGQSATSSTPAHNDSVLNSAPIINSNATVTNAQLAQATEDLAKYTQAQSLANQIVTLRTTYKPLPSMFDWGNYNQVNLQNGQITGEINAILAKMKNLVYKEVNGVATKL